MRVLGVWLAIALTVGVLGCGAKVRSIDVSPKKLKVYGIGNTQRVTARLLNKKREPVEDETVTWSSSNESIAEVDSSGRLTLKGPGKTIVTAKFEKLEAQIAVEVIDIKAIEVSPPSVQLIGPPGIQFPLQAVARNSQGKLIEMSLQWSSSKPHVATVDGHGVVSSVAPGATTIIARLGDLQAGCTVAVSVQDLARLEIRPAMAIVRTGDVQKFEVIGFGSDGRSIEGMSSVFHSSDPAVARIDLQGAALGVARGATTIRASVGSLKAEATLLVN